MRLDTRSSEIVLDARSEIRLFVDTTAVCFDRPFSLLFLLSMNSLSNGKFEKLFEVFQMQILQD